MGATLQPTTIVNKLINKFRPLQGSLMKKIARRKDAGVLGNSVSGKGVREGLFNEVAVEQRST